MTKIREMKYTLSLYYLNDEMVLKLENNDKSPETSCSKAFIIKSDTDQTVFYLCSLMVIKNHKKVKT